MQVDLEKFPRKENAQPLWATCGTAGLWGETVLVMFNLHLPFQLVPLFSQSLSMHDCGEPGPMFFVTS